MRTDGMIYYMVNVCFILSTDEGKNKKIKEKYLCKATGCTDAEAIVTAEFKDAQDIPALLAKMLEADAVLLAASRELEGTIERVVDGKTIIRARSTVLSQSIHHATEHRAQLVSALEAKGFTNINLDDYDLWAYCDAFGE